MRQTAVKPNDLTSSIQTSELLRETEACTLAEAKSKASLLRLSSKVIDLPISELTSKLPGSAEGRDALLAGLHQLRRRLETDVSVVSAAAARIEAALECAIENCKAESY